jgi:hypothetical protein
MKIHYASSIRHNYLKILRMKKQVGIWLDTDKAVLVNLSPNGEEVKTIESMIESRLSVPGEKKAYHRLGAMFLNSSKHHINKRKQQMNQYFNNIIKSVDGASNIFIFGPSITKIELEKEMKKHHEFWNKEIQISSADKMTQRQTIAFVKKHFNTDIAVAH